MSLVVGWSMATEVRSKIYMLLKLVIVNQLPSNRPWRETVIKLSINGNYFILLGIKQFSNGMEEINNHAVDNKRNR